MSATDTANDSERLLCSRRKNVDVYLMPSGRQFRVAAQMADGTHEMHLNMVVNQPSLRIKTVDCKMTQAPDTRCRKGQTIFESIIGRRIAAGLLSELKQHAAEGCTHLINLFHDACYTLALAQSELGREELNAAFPSLTEDQLYKIFMWFRPEMRNSCVRYAQDSPYMEKLARLEMPKGSEKLRAIAAGKNKIPN